MFYLTREEGGETLYLYYWNAKGSAWGGNAALAYSFLTGFEAGAIAARCSGPAHDGRDPQVAIIKV